MPLDEEEETAEEVGGRVQPRSGAGRSQKGDVKSDDFVIEHKLRTGSVIISYGMLRKAKQDCLITSGTQRTPAIKIEVVSKEDPKRRERWYLIPEALFLEVCCDRRSTNE